MRILWIHVCEHVCVQGFFPIWKMKILVMKIKNVFLLKAYFDPNIQYMILNSDKIYVIDNGNVIGEGKHDELIKNSEIYKNFYEKQIQKNWWE